VTAGAVPTAEPDDRLRRSEAHLFVDDLDDPRLSAEDRHHGERVLRLRPGMAITLSDGAGRWREARWGPEPEPTGPVRVHPAHGPPLTVGFALLKGERNEWVVQKLTELGIDVILPLAAERSVVRWNGERAVRHHERLLRVAREAAMQSRRVVLPLIVPVQQPGVVTGPEVALAEPGGSTPSLRHPCVLVGPEGGWSPSELAGERPTVGLGPAVLRAETAAVAAATLLTALRAGIVVAADCPSPAPRLGER
jgi:16S rRNA (uracil1498-N3)-methyltransferase